MRNYVELIGKPGADPVYKVLDSGNEFASMSLATTESYYDKEKKEKVEITDWHNVVAWRHNAKSLSFVKKGKLLMIIGRIKTRKYEDKNGVEKWITEVVADQVIFLEKMGSGQAKAEPNELTDGIDNKKTGVPPKINMQ